MHMLDKINDINCIVGRKRKQDEPVKWKSFDETNRIRRSKSKCEKRRNIISGPNRENITVKLR